MQPMPLSKVPDTVQPFWVTFLIQSALGALAAFIASNTKIKPNVKAAAEKLITDGNAFIALL